jgi:hypothetical protein
MKLDDYKKVRVGDRLLLDGCTVGKVEIDQKYTDGLKCLGMSVKYIFENYSDVEWIRYVSK